MEKKMLTQKTIHPELLEASVWLNGYSPLIPWADAIGLKPNWIKYAGRPHSAVLTEEYLVNSYHTRHDAETAVSVENFYDDSVVVTQALNHQRDYTGLPIIPLPKGIALESELGEVILRRRSTGQFTGDTVPFDYLATIARAAQGTSGNAIVSLQQGSEVPLIFSTVSSAGQLYPVDIYFMVLNVKELEKGIYLYSMLDDAFIKTGGISDISNLLSGFSTQVDSLMYQRANYIVMFAAHPWKSVSKYGGRGLRFVLQEIGAISQNIHLANVCLGLSSTDWGGYYENEINQAMNFDGVNQTVLHLLLAGISG
jgi:SagB-type dehydrogenase family enzyme